MKNILAIFFLGATILNSAHCKIGKLIKKDSISHNENIYTTYEKGPRFSIKFDSETLTLKFVAELPNDSRLGIVFGDDYDVKGSDFIVFDTDEPLPMDMYGYENDILIRDTKYNPVNPAPLPIKEVLFPNSMGYYWKFTYYRKPDTGEP